MGGRGQFACDFVGITIQLRYNVVVGRVEAKREMLTRFASHWEWELGLFSDFAIDVDDLELLQAIIIDACNELRLSPDRQDLVARIVDLRSRGHSEQAILETLRVEFGNPIGRRRRHTAVSPETGKNDTRRIRFPSSRSSTQTTRKGHPGPGNPSAIACGTGRG